MEPFQRSGGPWGAPKGPQMAQNGHFGAISGCCGSGLMEQCGKKAEQVRAHPRQCNGAISQVRNGRQGIWSLKIAFCGHLWPFGILWGPSGTPVWPSLTRETVPMHHQGYALTCSILVPHCTTSYEPPDPLMAQKGRFWPFWTLWGPSGTPRWPSPAPKTVPIHYWGCALTCSPCP